MILFIQFFLYFSTSWSAVTGTSMKMDFLPLGDVRTDPIINPDCLSDHVHTFYGVNTLRPETTYEDLRNANGNSGNVKQNKSLYWHPTVYQVDPDTGVHRKVDIHFASTYYIWNTGAATAFPDGFKMVAGVGGIPQARANAECVAPFPCERANCESEDTSFFPATGCAELEVSMAFPICWDGVNLDSDDHMSHVSYDLDGGRFDGECPDTHPVKFPEIQFFFRIIEYTGGSHTFADGSSFFHADYFSGWNESELQQVLDECSNYSEAANPDAWCEDFVEFRDAPKVLGEDDDIVTKLQTFQPNPPFDTMTITTEETDNVINLPRGACTGTLIPAEPTSPSSTITGAPSSAPHLTAAPSPSSSGSRNCIDSELKFLLNGKVKSCSWVARKPEKRCSRKGVANHCPLSCHDTTGSCNVCNDSSRRFVLTTGKRKNCRWVKKFNTEARCQRDGVDTSCQATCGLCGD